MPSLVKTRWHSMLAEGLAVLAGVLSAVAYQLGPFVNFTPRRAALDDLLSSGGVQLIRSDTLRRELAAYERALAEDHLAQEEVREFWRLELSPFHNEHGNLRGVISEGRIGGDIPLPELQFKPDLNAYLGKQHANLMVHRILLTQRVRSRHDELLAPSQGSLH